MNALKYSFMILLSVFISCDDDDDDYHHHDPNWSYRLQQQPQPPHHQDVRLTFERPTIVQDAS